MGTGVGEMALMDALIGGAETGAAIGGGKALLTGQDPLRGALMGGLMGGATGGIMNGVMPGAAGTMPTVSEGAIAPTSFANAPVDMTTYAPTPTQFGAFGEAPGSVLDGAQNFGDFGQAPDLTSTMPVSDAAQQAASRSFGTSQIGANTPPVGSSMGQWWNVLTDKQKMLTGGAGVLGLGMLSDRNKYGVPKQAPYTGPLSRFTFNPSTYRATPYADGGITTLNSGGYDRQVGEEPYPTGMNSGGIANLGSYSDGGHMMKGPGDGMSDSIPATIAGKRPARLATDEFVVPADVVSHLGNGSSDAGAKQLYAMMDKVRQARTGNKRQGREINPGKYMPA
jgi:hypothetical protein